MTTTETQLWCCFYLERWGEFFVLFSSCYWKASFKKAVLSIVKMIMYSQTGIQCVSVAAALQAKQGPGEPSKDCLSEFREPVGARLWATKSHRAPVRARESHREGQLEPEGAREPESKPESYTTNSSFWLCSYAFGRLEYRKEAGLKYTAWLNIILLWNQIQFCFVVKH